MDNTSPYTRPSAPVAVNYASYDSSSSAGKENRRSWTPPPAEEKRGGIECQLFERAFEDMLEERDIPHGVRSQLRSMDHSKKLNILRASESQTRLPPSSTTPSRHTPSPYVLHKSRARSSSFSSPFEPPSSAPAPRVRPTSELPNPKKSGADSPVAFAAMLAREKSTTMDVERVKKLRSLIRAESVGWLADFLGCGGYEGLLERLEEILGVEWREEQHDDQLLHELLRCFKGLTTTDIGKSALLSSSPRPFAPLVALLYTDKKPGSLSTRQLLIELLTAPLELYSTSPAPPPLPHDTAAQLVRALLLNPRDEEAEKVHDFIRVAKKPRVFKMLLNECYEIERDFFWCFGHKSNGIWSHADVDVSAVQRLRFRVPGGMTAGVEYEAIGYLTAVFTLTNDLCESALREPAHSPANALQLHADLFASGIDRHIYTARQASLTHYPLLHYQLSRYLSLAARAGFSVPWSVARFLCAPPEHVCRARARARLESAHYSKPGIGRKVVRGGEFHDAPPRLGEMERGERLAL